MVGFLKMGQRRLVKSGLPLAFIALLLASLAPQGFMPMQTANGLAIMICSGHVPATDHSATNHSSLGDKHNQSPHDPDNWEKSVCGFAAAQTIGIDFSSSGIALQLEPARQHQLPQAGRFALRNRIDLPPATGPPLSF